MMWLSRTTIRVKIIIKMVFRLKLYNFLAIFWVFFTFTPAQTVKTDLLSFEMVCFLVSNTRASKTIRMPGERIST